MCSADIGNFAVSDETNNLLLGTWGNAVFDFDTIAPGFQLNLVQMVRKFTVDVYHLDTGHHIKCACPFNALNTFCTRHSSKGVQNINGNSFL